MSNVLIQYDWNNHKEVNQKRLTELFVALKLSDKIKVYRVLSDKRKLTLRKGYDKWKKEAHKKVLDVHRKYVLAPLADLISPDELKTHEEIMLTLGILLADTGSGYYDNASSNNNVEAESFKKAKQKMLMYYEIMHLRKNGRLPHEEEDFFVKLQELEYIPPTTFTDLIKYKKEKWLQCYLYIGVGKERAERLSRALAKRFKIIQSYYPDEYTLIKTRQAYSEWRNNIPPNMREEGVRLFAITGYYVDKD